jgi:steroid delta-isomerase-like uncharacterized protein
MAHPNEVLVRRWFAEVWNERNLAAIDELVDPSSVGHTEIGRLQGIPAWREMFDSFVHAMPDLRTEIEDVIADDTRAVVRWHFTGTHTGAMEGIAPTNRTVGGRGTTWFRIANGRVAEAWDTWNQAAFFESLAGGIVRASS